MDILYLGHSSFRIKTRSATIIADPFSSAVVGWKFPKTEADIVTVSHQHQDHNQVEAVGGEPFIVSLPGEYEIKGISIFGYSSFHDKNKGAERGPNTIFVIEAEGLRLCHLGDLGVLPPAEVMEEIIGVDVLMVPVGGKYTLGPEEAVEAVNQIEPSIVLPMHFRVPGLTELADLNEFLTEMGAEKTERLDKLSLTKDKLPEETRVVVLEKKS
ncbi:MAG TPA: MBL fold metallo-hydrolase [Patescibacteria group bacterium]|nr:MBL fold metallo-hydrolase [Patescibacteria group bacterium]